MDDHGSKCFIVYSNIGFGVDSYKYIHKIPLETWQRYTYNTSLIKINIVTPLLCDNKMLHQLKLRKIKRLNEKTNVLTASCCLRSVCKFFRIHKIEIWYRLKKKCFLKIQKWNIIYRWTRRIFFFCVNIGYPVFLMSTLQGEVEGALGKKFELGQKHVKKKIRLCKWVRNI